MARPFPSYDDAFAWLARHTNYETMAVQDYDERTYGLDRVERLLDRAGRPDHTADVVQIVGSKGKGSTAIALDAILRAAGRRTGLFTSPHLVDARERVRVAGEPAPDASMCAALSTLREHVEGAAAAGAPCTFFEILTVAALVAFREAGCDAVVLEAGMGGRLDATTAARARLKILTSISLDHVAQLGRTRAAVAAEKAAAAREDVPVVSGVPADTAEGRVVAAACADAGAPLLVVGDAFSVRGVRTVLGPDGAETSFTLAHADTRARFRLPVAGRHQATNAALAVVAARATPWSAGPLPESAIATGLASVRMPARFEVVGTDPLVVLDGAHSPASMSRLAAAVRELAPGATAVFVVGMAGDKDTRGSLRRLRGAASHVIATAARSPRAARPQDIAAGAREAGIEAETAAGLDGALRAAKRRAGKRGMVVVTGSLYLCGEALASSGSTSGP